jgi:hypothetical protein
MHARTHARTHARARAHTHTHTRTLQAGVVVGVTRTLFESPRSALGRVARIVLVACCEANLSLNGETWGNGPDAGSSLRKSFPGNICWSRPMLCRRGTQAKRGAAFPRRCLTKQEEPISPRKPPVARANDMAPVKIIDPGELSTKSVPPRRLVRVKFLVTAHKEGCPDTPVDSDRWWEASSSSFWFIEMIKKAGGKHPGPTCAPHVVPGGRLAGKAKESTRARMPGTCWRQPLEYVLAAC